MRINERIAILETQLNALTASLSDMKKLVWFIAAAVTGQYGVQLIQ